jgi:hypothetical protein
VWWFTPIIPALRRLRQEEQEFKDSVGCIAKPCLKNTMLAWQAQWLAFKSQYHQNKQRNKTKLDFM